MAPPLTLPLRAIALAAAVTVVFFSYAWVRLSTLESSAFDLAYFDQVVWNGFQGHGFTSSFAPYPFFGQHFSPALAAFVPFYAIHPSPLWLLGGQSLALGFAMVPLFLLARMWLGEKSALIACLAYAAQLFVLRAANYDFHTEALGVPFVFWAVLGAVRASRAGDITLILAGVAPLLFKEDGALVSLGIGFLALAVFRRRAGLILMAVALVYGLVVTTVVMPAIRGGQPGDLIGRYSYLGSSASGVLMGLVEHPGAALQHLLSPGPLMAVALLLGGVAFLPLARPLAFSAAMPALLLALLSQKWQQETLLDQYGLQSGPLIFIAALIGWARILPLLRRALSHVRLMWLTPERALRGALVVSTLTVLSMAAPTFAIGSWRGGLDAQSLASQVPPEASVDASSDLLPMLAERDSIGLLPSHQREWVAVDAATDSSVLAALSSDGYVLTGRWGKLSLWHRLTPAAISRV